MPDEVAYVFQLSDNARPRLAALASIEHGEVWGLVEWQQDQGGVIERLSLAQLRAMGVVTDVRDYGVRLVYQSHVIVVTAWPLPPPTTTDQTAQQQAPEERQPVATPETQGASWKANALAKAYTPPEQMKGPEQSDWRPSH